MSDDVVISVEGLSKRYLIGHEGPQERYHSLRDSLVRHGKILPAQDPRHGARAAIRRCLARISFL